MLRLYQIAYNSGQLKAQLEMENEEINKSYSREMIAFMKENEIHKLETFISEDIKIDNIDFINLIKNIDIKIIEYLD